MFSDTVTLLTELGALLQILTNIWMKYVSVFF